MSLIDEHRSGLPCRYQKCSLVFYPAADTMADLQAAVRFRNAHEEREHGYVHVEAPPPPKWDFATAMTQRGRSRLGRRSGDS
jgi:hypothetical protein